MVRVHHFVTGVSAASSLLCFLPAPQTEFQKVEVEGHLTSG